MSIFNWGEAGKVAEGVGNAVSGTIESINYALSGDLPPDVRVKLEDIKLKMQQVESKIMEGQVELNKEEAKSPSFLKSAWRPMVAWVGVIGFSLVFVIFPILEWALNIYIVFNNIYLTEKEVLALKPPSIDGWLLLNLLGSMMGIGYLRTREKEKGITK